MYYIRGYCDPLPPLKPFHSDIVLDEVRDTRSKLGKYAYAVLAYELEGYYSLEEWHRLKAGRYNSYKNSYIEGPKKQYAIAENEVRDSYVDDDRCPVCRVKVDFKGHSDEMECPNCQHIRVVGRRQRPEVRVVTMDQHYPGGYHVCGSITGAERMKRILEKEPLWETCDLRVVPVRYKDAHTTGMWRGVPIHVVREIKKV